MPDLTLYHLTPHGPFHLSLRGVGQEKTDLSLPSDSLFAALLLANLEVGGEIEKLAGIFPQYDQAEASREVEAEPQPIPFLVTSTFPRAGELRFYPAPPSLEFLLSRDKIGELEQGGELKKIKKIKFISEGLFERMVKGEKLDAWLPFEAAPSANEMTQRPLGLFLQGTTLWLMGDEAHKLPDSLLKDDQKKARPLQALRYVTVWQVSQVPRVTVDRMSNASEIFYTGRVTFRAGCGWWLGIAWNPSWEKKHGLVTRQVIEQALKLLADTGLGGERAAGYGQFEVEKAGTKNWPNPNPNDLFITLSRYHPHHKELPAALQAEESAYKLVSVGGWLSSPGQKAQRRKRLWLLAEGSVLRAAGAGPWGNITDVKPDYLSTSEAFPHPIWRYGLACPVALKGGVP
ncbi:MAG: type III-A CRISPR-associated RAMP protein Csm4 [Anaerolineales bacterium]|nr:type III-A CRISPR-associated RAMP protein Csm4 [Anaerolineales bacterium]